MPNFQYKALSPDGDIIEGQLFSDDRRGVIERLRDRGAITLSAEVVRREKVAERAQLSGLFPKRRLTPGDTMLLTRELAFLLAARLPLDMALQRLAGITRKPAARELIERLEERVRAGASFARAIEDEGDVFPPYYAGMVRAGEAGGSLDEAIERLAEMLEARQKLKRELSAAMTYPILVLGLTITSLLILFTYVVPELRPLFGDHQTALPVAARAVFAAADIVEHSGWLILACALGLFTVIRYGHGHTSARTKIDGMLLRLPLIGDLITKLETARFLRTLATLTHNGIAHLAALEMAQGSVSNTIFRRAVPAMRRRLSEGQGLADPLEESGLFPSLATQLLRVGEESGRLEDMLERTADLYDEELRRSLRRVVSLLVPVVTIVLGILIAGVIGSILSAILSVYELPF
jgi:general secretion pathway protein F